MKTKILLLLLWILLGLTLQFYFISKTLIIEKNKIDDKINLIIENYRKQEQQIKDEIEKYQNDLKAIIVNKEIEEKKQIKKIIEIEVYNKFLIINKLNDWITYWKVRKSPETKNKITYILQNKKYILFKYILKEVKNNEIISKKEYTLNCFIKFDKNKLWTYYDLYSLDKLDKKYKDFYCIENNGNNEEKYNDKIKKITNFIYDTKYYKDIIINYNENIIDDDNINIYFDNYRKIDWYINKYFKE